MKKVLVFIPSIESGGVEKNAIIVANELLAQGYEVSVLYCRIIEEKRQAFSDGIEMVQFDRKKIPLINPRLTDAFFMKKSLREYLCKQNAENTVLIAFQSASVAIGVCKKLGVKVICRLSNHPIAVKYEKNMLRTLSEWLKPHTYKKADAIIANSKQLADDFGAKIQRDIVTIYNPIDFMQLENKKKEEIEPELLQEAQEYEGRLLIAVGRLTLQKDYDTLIKGFACSQRKDTKLWIIGEGTERSHIEELIKELYLSERVRLLGYRNNVYKYLKYGTIYVLSSRYEGCPNSLIEAVAVGIPCISSDCLTGPREVLLDGTAGLLFPCGNEILLGECIDILLCDSKKSLALQKQAKSGLDRFEVHRTIEAYKTLIG